jgi:hypothetical protein
MPSAQTAIPVTIAENAYYEKFATSPLVINAGKTIVVKYWLPYRAFSQ